MLFKFISDIANGGVVDVPMNIDLELPIIIEKDVTINLNGYTITAPIFTESNGEIIEGNTDSYVFWIKNGTLTVNGDGKLNAQNANYSIAVWVNGGNAVINGGTYSNSGDNCDLIYISNKGNLEINGGEFIATENKGATGTTNKRSAINIKDKDKSKCNVSVKGGKFYEFNPADNASENPKQNFVAEGYNVTKSGNWYEVNKAN